MTMTQYDKLHKLKFLIFMFALINIVKEGYGNLVFNGDFESYKTRDLLADSYGTLIKYSYVEADGYWYSNLPDKQFYITSSSDRFPKQKYVDLYGPNSYGREQHMKSYRLCQKIYNIVSGLMYRYSFEVAVNNLVYNSNVRIYINGEIIGVYFK